MSRLRAITALATALVALVTVLTAFAIARANRVYVGGLAWPFISDLGRDPPGSYVLFFGLNIVAVLLGLTWSFNHEHKHRFLQESLDSGQVSRVVCSLSYVSCIFGVVGAFGLPVFAAFDASPALHNNSAFGFLLCESVATFTNTYLNYRIFLVKRSEMDTGVFITDRYGPRSVSRIKLSELQAVKRGFVIELSCVMLFAMCVIVYLPVLYNGTDAPHLTIAKCIAKKLGGNYCSVTMKLDGVYTKLWDYEKDIAVHQVRAIAQLGLRNVDKVQVERRRQEMEHNALHKFAQGNQLQALQNQSDANVSSRRRMNYAAQLSAERMLEEAHAQKLSEQQRASRERQQNEALAHVLETSKKEQEQQEREVQRICEASEELRELETFLKTAYMNKDRATQQLERETLTVLDRQREIAIEQQMEYDRQRSLVEMHNLELRKRAEAEQGKLVLQTQMLQRQDLRHEAQLEADFERCKIEKLMQQVEEEDAAELARRQLAREQTREMIDQTQQERERFKQERVISAQREDEAIAEYRRRVEAREADIKAASEVKKAHEDAMFRAVEAEIQAKMREDEEIERLRDELWEEELLQKKRAQEEEKIAAKLQAKDEMMRSNEMQMQLKQELLARQRADEEAFNGMLRERFRSEERREMELAAFRRKQRDQFAEEITRHRALKQEMVYAELQHERRERERQERDEDYRRQVVEAAKQRLLREHADVLQGYLPRALRPSSSSSTSRLSAFR
ncbi:hypothetical protein BBO99_00005485 [Phytophthora kernoviae]|uniref:Meiosis-specific nuclear structural protein 1 n=2 Tax=Phytophthora kernoviae TaxID=325452 RepID=A0A3R7HHU6_9STRA|nr:hypothetical protein G195_006444 [Phytophthora kernoviae 00238/432]KAG2523132.1 hypothetical protein JM16_005377 [Phytophthora kernoviae]KAG2524853.1 hypothetical protein JM18_004948 [Phytophthora kernoviae]RLN20078.1 hypothetical protein BBI17_005559 [Phytophthora kernoviae]RLN79143.1 hypothetical protein BBO99_00005485 [Phytophthora kernoviae]